MRDFIECLHEVSTDLGQITTRRMFGAQALSQATRNIG
jgi:TfoX/Sxy family transcriptional regulator of competence genes